MRKVESRQQGPSAKKAKLTAGKLLAACCRAYWVTECMKKKKSNIIR